MENFGNFSSEKFQFNVGFKIFKISKIRINVIIFFCGNIFKKYHTFFKIFQNRHFFYNVVLYFFKNSKTGLAENSALIFKNPHYF